MAAFPESADIPADVIYAGELEIRLEEGLVLATGQPLMLSVREFEVLVALARRLGAIITREELYMTVWAGSFAPGIARSTFTSASCAASSRRRSPIAASSTPIQASVTASNRSLHEMFTWSPPAVEQTPTG